MTVAAAESHIVRKYILSLGLNFLGVGIQGVVIPWLLLELTHAPSAVGGLLVLRGLVAVFLSPYAGSLADRLERRTLAVAVNFAVGGALLIYAALLLTGSASVLSLYAVTLVMSLGNAFFLPASYAHIQSLVDKPQYMRVASVREIAMQVGVIGGTFVAGLMLHAYPQSVVFAVVGGCFLSSAATFLLLPRGDQSVAHIETAKRRQSSHRNMWEMATDPVMRGVILLFMIPTLAIQVDNVLMSGYVQQVLKASSFSFSLVNMAYSVGALAAGLTMSRYSYRIRAGVVAVSLLLAGIGLAHLLFGVSQNILTAILAASMIGLTVVPLRVFLNTSLMIAAGNEYAGSAQAAVQMAASIAVILIGLFAGVGAQTFGYLAGFSVVPVICLLGCVGVVLADRGVRTGERLGDERKI
jgi:MFS family permease